MAAIVALGLSALAAIAVFIAWSPWMVGLGSAIACATGWCIWMERHPE